METSYRLSLMKSFKERRESDRVKEAYDFFVSDAQIGFQYDNDDCSLFSKKGT